MGSPQFTRQFEGELRPNELPEYQMLGPFGGIQSEVASDLIGREGFQECLNMILRKGRASVRPGYNTLNALPSTPTEETNGIADFFKSDGTRVQVRITPTRLFRWDGSGIGFTEITKAGGLTGAITDLFTWTVVANKLLFCQGVDKVQVWDGSTATFADADANAVPAKFMMELNKHLVVGNLVEGGIQHQRVRWTAAGDTTDWTGFNAGQNDLFNDLGPISGMSKLYQNGYIHQQWGITQVIPTGLGLRPFDFRPLTSRAKGNIAPHSLATYGEQIACYVGKDNVYMFNASESVGIGDAPLQGFRGRVGAKKRIMAELLQANLSLVKGFISTSVDGNDFLAYWLNIPTGSTWIYNFNEENWTRFVFDKTIRTVGDFSAAELIRILDLIGAIQDQQWTPATLQSNNPLDSFGIGFDDGTFGLFDFGTVSESSWLIRSGELTLGSRRHRKTIVKFRLGMVDNGPVTFNLKVTNEDGQSETQEVTVGTGTGKALSKVIAFKINGVFLTWEVSGDAGANASFVEFAPIYSLAGEQRG